MEYICSECGARVDEDALQLLCACGGLLDPPAPDPFAPTDVDVHEAAFWRYAKALPRVPTEHRPALGERRTPLVRWASHGSLVWLKLDYLLPTGSYKDRGAAVMIAKLRALGVRAVMDDSSGNAGAALAAYAAAAGMPCVVYAPASNSPGKLAQIRAYGADLRPIVGERDATVGAAVREAGESMFYASHNRHPAFLLGVATLGFELWEDFHGRLPRNIVVPAGQGSIVLGLWHAFRALLAGGAIRTLPRILAIQAHTRPALADAWARGANTVVRADDGDTIAEGIAAVQPIRGSQVLRALRDTSGSALAVGEEDIVAALRRLGRAGYYVEPTSAVALAGFDRAIRDGLIAPEESSLLVLTGSGLKTSWPEHVQMG